MEYLEEIIDHRKPFLRREAVWAASNIIADGAEMIEKAIESSIFIKLLNAIIMDIDQVSESRENIF